MALPLTRVLRHLWGGFRPKAPTLSKDAGLRRRESGCSRAPFVRILGGRPRAGARGPVTGRPRCRRHCTPGRAWSPGGTRPIGTALLRPGRAPHPPSRARPEPSAGARPRFRLIVFDWDGTAVPSRDADASVVVGLSTGSWARAPGLRDHRHELPERGAAARPRHHARARPAALRLRQPRLQGVSLRPTAAPPCCCTAGGLPRGGSAASAVADACATHRALTGLPIDRRPVRLNRRKIDLIPSPASATRRRAIGELLAATEARLRGAGLRDGVREVLRDDGAPGPGARPRNARVTSDVKHSRSGSPTRPNDGAVLHDVAAPLGIEPRDVLLAGDELGAVAGFEGSDHRMLAGARGPRRGGGLGRPRARGVPPR